MCGTVDPSRTSVMDGFITKVQESALGARLS